MKASIFVGPTLGSIPRCVGTDAAWEWRPPARQGDIYRCARDGGRVIGLIDGVFRGAPSVQHAEIRWAIEQGAIVCGASSMGALRAAELHEFGMVGVGRIFEDYRDGILTRDDEVAIEYGPAELDYPTLCEALVNLRATLSRAEALGLLTCSQCQRLIEVATSTPYPRRTASFLADAYNAAYPNLPVSQSVVEWLIANRTDQKREDAFQLLSLTSRLAQNPLKVGQHHPFAETEYFSAFRGRFDNAILRDLP